MLVAMAAGRDVAEPTRVLKVLIHGWWWWEKFLHRFHGVVNMLIDACSLHSSVTIELRTGRDLNLLRPLGYRSVPIEKIRGQVVIIMDLYL